MEFIGRNSELAKLQRMFASEPQEVTLIYGRRRVGKSELIKHFLRNYAPKGIYYECKRTSEANNTATLAALIAEAYGFPPLAFPSFEALLDFLKSCPPLMPSANTTMTCQRNAKMANLT